MMTSLFDGSVIVGVDPGYVTSVSVISGEDAAILDTKSFRVYKGGYVGECENIRALYDFLKKYQNFIKRAVIERVWGFPQQSVQSVSGFLYSAGTIPGVLAGLNLKPTWVDAPKWKGHYALGSNKKASIAKVKDFYPGTNIRNHNLAESILIARYIWETDEFIQKDLESHLPAYRDDL